MISESGFHGTSQAHLKKNKTDLQPIPRPVEQAHYFEGWLEDAKSLWCQGFVDRQNYRNGISARCIKVGKNVFKIRQTHRHT